MLLLGFLTGFRSPMHLFVNTPIVVFAITFMFYRGTALNITERRFATYGGIPPLADLPHGPWDFSTMSKSRDPYLERYPLVEWQSRGSFSQAVGVFCLDSDSPRSPKEMLKALEPHHAAAQMWESSITALGFTLSFREGVTQVFVRLDRTTRGSRVFLVVCPAPVTAGLSANEVEAVSHGLFRALEAAIATSCVPN